MSRPLLAELAERICAHLVRFESDPAINVNDPQRGHPYFHANSRVGGRWVYVKYVSYHGETNLTRAQAEEYLAWLDAGNVGSHYEQRRMAKVAARSTRTEAP